MMKKILLLLLAAAAIAVSAEDVKRPMTADDSLNLVRVKDVRISPGGTKIFYGKETLDWKENKYTTTYYMCSSDGTGKRIFLRKGLEAQNFRFSPDGGKLAFLSQGDKEENKKGKKEQIFLIAVDGGEARPLTRHAAGVKDYQWLKNSNHIVFLADEARTTKEQKEYELGADAVFVDEAPNGKENARFSRLWYFDPTTGKESLICKENLVIREFDVSPDGKRFVFAGLPDKRTNYPFLSELYIINSDGTGFHRLTKNKGPESNPKWSPDGKTIIFHAPYQSVEKGQYDLRSGYFWLLNTETGKFRRLESQKQGEMYRGDVGWSPDGRYFYFNQLHRTNTNLFRIDVKKDKLETMTRVTGTLRPKSFSADMKKMVYTFQDYQTPEDIYVSDLYLKKTVQITHANPRLKKEFLLSSAKPVQWKSSKDGLEIEGLFYSPPADKKGKKVPLIVHIHGGPAGVIENSFRPEFHIFGGLGYAVLGPNYRGSTGYGDTILRGLMGEVGDGEHVDIMSGVDYVIAAYNIDPDRMAVRGWSWGGVSTGYLVTHVHRFKAASAGAGVYNWAAECGPGYSYDVSLWYIGGTPWDNPKEWAERSAITHVKKVRTPLLLLHGGNDITSSVSQSLMYFTALRDLGKVPVRYIKFPRQGHGIDEPRLQRIRLLEEIRWFKKYME
ncbi:MAG: S9 family peptidase [bacterium]|nr:S9 family peptidase [bacterium]